MVEFVFINYFHCYKAHGWRLYITQVNSISRPDPCVISKIQGDGGGVGGRGWR